MIFHPIKRSRRPLTRSVQPPFRPPANSEEVSDWQTLRVGDHLIILDTDGVLMYGRIQELSDQSDVLWIIRDHFGNRCLVARTVNQSIWRTSEPAKAKRRRPERAEQLDAEHAHRVWSVQLLEIEPPPQTCEEATMN